METAGPLMSELAGLHFGLVDGDSISVLVGPGSVMSPGAGFPIITETGFITNLIAVGAGFQVDFEVGTPDRFISTPDEVTLDGLPDLIRVTQETSTTEQ